MTETMVRQRPEASSKKADIQQFATSEAFAGLRPDLKNAAVARVVFYTEASTPTVNAHLTALYEGGNTSKFGGFNHREKETFGTLEAIKSSYGDLYDKKIEEENLPPQAAYEAVDRQRRVDVASRYARNDFAKLLNYLPGKEGAPGDTDYAATIFNAEFLLADQLVRESVEKFS